MKKKIILGLVCSLLFPYIAHATGDNCVTGYEGQYGWGSAEGIIEGITISETCYTDSSHKEKIKTITKTYDVDSQYGYYLDYTDQGQLIYTNGTESIILNDNNTIKVTEAKEYNGSEHATQVNTKWIWPNGDTTYSTNYFDTEGNPMGYTAQFNGGTIEYTLNDAGNFEVSINTYDNDGNILIQGNAIMKPPFGNSLMGEMGTMNFHVDRLENIKMKSYDYGENVTETICNVNSMSSLSIEGMDIDYNSCQQKQYTRKDFETLQNGIKNPIEPSSGEETHIVRRIYTVEEAVEALGSKGRNTFSIRYR